MFTKWGKVLFRNFKFNNPLIEENAGKLIIEAKDIFGDIVYYGRGAGREAISSVITDTLNNMSRGVAIGSDGTAATENDYTLGNQITGFTANGVQFNRSGYLNDSDNCKFYTTMSFTITNTGESDMVVREIGLFGYGYTPSTVQHAVQTRGSNEQHNNAYYRCFMLAREILDTPLTITPGNIGTITLKFEWDLKVLDTYEEEV